MGKRLMSGLQRRKTTQCLCISRCMVDALLSGLALVAYGCFFSRTRASLRESAVIVAF